MRRAVCVAALVAASFLSLDSFARTSFLGFTSPVDTSAVNPQDTASVFGKQKLHSMHATDAPAIDTLDTGNDYIKIVLYSDNTWQYMTSEQFSHDSDVYSTCWSHEHADAYGIPLDSLPTAWSIWVADSTTHYRCPYVGSVYYRGKFGPRNGRRHLGVDLPLTTGTPIYATFDGKVRIARYLGGYGNLVVLRHPNGLETFYGHLSRIDVKEDDWVSAGQVIGLGGSTGRSTGPHLHFETRYKGYAFDPQWLIEFKTGDLRQRMFVLKKKYFSIYSNYEQNFDDDEEGGSQTTVAPAPTKQYYRVKQGDTLSAIARKYHTSVGALCRLNGIKETSILRIGQNLRVK